jgi:hypothetical protein
VKEEGVEVDEAGVKGQEKRLTAAVVVVFAAVYSDDVKISESLFMLKLTPVEVVMTSISSGSSVIS